MRIVALLLALALTGCDREARVLGRWEAVSIDGVGPAVAAASRVVFPAGAYGADTLAADFMWHEVAVDSLVLDVRPDGSYDERLVERQRTLVQKNSYVRPDYVSSAFGGDLIREEQPPAGEASSGSWTLAGDSIVMVRPRAAWVGAVTARVHAAFPTAPADAVRAAVDGGLPADPGPRWTGRVRADLLELRDEAGRRFAFRKVPDGR